MTDEEQRTYKEAVKHWYVEWMPHWEDEQTMRGLGFTLLVETTHDSIKERPIPVPARPPKDHHLCNMDKQVQPEAPQERVIIGQDIRKRCCFITEDCDPHTDIQGTDKYILQLREVLRRYTLPNGQRRDESKDMVTVHDPTGRTVGMLDPYRVAMLQKNYTAVMQTRPDMVERLAPQPFAEEVANLLRRYKDGVSIPGTNRKV